MAEEGKKRALIIGINYKGSEFDELKCTESDAQDICDALLNPDTRVFEKEDVHLLIGELKSDDVRMGLGKIIKDSKKEDTILIYFSGHGKLDDTEKLCLVTHNTKKDMLPYTSVPLAYIVEEIKKKNFKHTVLILDSCYSGIEGEKGIEEKFPQLLDQISGQGIVVISASQKLKTAKERPDLGHSIFTHYLIKGLKEGKADDGSDPYVSIGKLFDYVGNEVKKETGYEQVPEMWSPKKDGGEDGSTEILIAKSVNYRNRIEIKGLVQTSKELAKKGNFEEAVEVFNKVFEFDPENKEAHREIKEIIEAQERRKRFMINHQIYIIVEENFQDKKKRVPYHAVLRVIKPYSYLSEGEKKYYRLVENLLNEEPSPSEEFSRILRDFIDTWNVWEELEQAGKRQQTKAVPAVRQDTVKAESVKTEDIKHEKQTSGSGHTETATTSAPTPTPSTRNQVFISYSHKDKGWLDKFQTMFAPIEQKYKIEIWSDERIQTGAEWREEIKKALASAKVAVLLLSDNFFKSEFITKNELPPLLNAAKEEGVVIFRVHVSTCLWEETGIEPYQAAHNPIPPLDLLPGGDAEQKAVLADICKKIKKAMNPISGDGE